MGSVVLLYYLVAVHTHLPEFCSQFLQAIGTYLPDYMIPHSRRQH